jgi:hypothetical protein
VTVTLCEFLEGLSKGSLKSAGALTIYEAAGAILRHGSRVAGAESSEARGFLNIVFGNLGEHLSQLLARLGIGAGPTRCSALKNSMRGAKLGFLGDCTLFCTKFMEFTTENSEDTEGRKKGLVRYFR